MAFFHDMRHSRTVKFFLVHAVTSLVASAILLSKNAHVHEPFFPPYFMSFSSTFFGSLAGAFLSLNQLIGGIFKGFPGAGVMMLSSHAVPMPVVSGVLALGGVVLAVAGKQLYRSKAMYLLFFLASILFLACSYNYFLDQGNRASALLGNPAFVQPEK